MSETNRQSYGCQTLWLVLVLFLFPGVLTALAVIAVLAALVIKAPKLTGAVLVIAAAASLIQFLTLPDLLSWDFDSAYTALVMVLGFLFVIAAGWKLFAWGLRGGLASGVSALRYEEQKPALVLAAPRIASINPFDDLSIQDQQEELHAAMEDARRIARSTNCGLEVRKRIFESVLRRECDQRGVRLAAVKWKKRQSP